MAVDSNDERIQALKAKLDSRKGRPGFEDNVREIEAEIDRLENGRDG